MAMSATKYFKGRGLQPGGGGAWFVPSEPISLYRSNGRLSAKEMARLDVRRTYQVAGKNALPPINYGRTPVEPLIMQVRTASGDLVIGAVWGIGLHDAVEELYINGAPPTAGMTVTHYLGTTTQGVDANLAAAIPAYNSDMVLRTPDGDEGLCYTSIRIPPGEIDGVPRINGVVRGIRPIDPDLPTTANAAVSWRLRITASNTTDSFFCDVAEIEFRDDVGGTDQTPGGTYFSSDEGGNPSANAFDDNAATYWRASAGPATIGCTQSSAYVCRQVAIQAGDNSFRAGRAPKDFVVEYSHDGTNWNTALEVEGETAWGVSETRTFTVEVQPTNRPYTDNTARCFYDLATNPVYGLGAEVLGLQECADWDDELIEGVERSRLAISLIDPKLTSEHLSFIATHGDFIWYNEGDAVQMTPDGPVTEAEGQSYVTDPDFDTAGDWTLGTGWSIGAGEAYAVDPGAESAISEQLEFPRTQTVTVTVIVDELYDGSVRAELGGVEVIGAQTAPGTYTATVDVAVDNPLFEVIASADFQGDISFADVQAFYWTVTEWVDGSLSLEGVDDRDSPTKIWARYRDPVSGTAVWPDELTPETRAGVEEGEVKLLETTISYPGTYRLEEAQLKAAQRKARYENQVKVSYGDWDIGARHRPGSVIRLLDPNEGVDTVFKVDSIALVDYGRHRLSGMRYDLSHYPETIVIPGDAGVVPVGAILPLAGETVPSGWAEYTSANGRFLIGAGDEYASQDTGGSETFAGWSGNTTESDSHGDSPSYTEFKVATRRAGAEPFVFRLGDDNAVDTTHAHSYDTGTITPDLFRRSVKLVQKTGSTSSTFPVEVTPFGLPGLLASGMSRLTSNAGRLLMADIAANNAGVAAKFLSITTGNYDDTHDHTKLESAGADDLVNATVNENRTGGSDHNHTANPELVRNVKRGRLALYSGTQAMPVLPGMMVLWDEVANGPIPSSWILCDGTNSTPDMQNRLIEIAAEGNENTVAGDNTLSINVNTSSREHDHDGPSSTGTKSGTNNVRHSNKLSHRHSVSRSDTWLPPYFGISVIMYSPS